jgi:hypothetical protein
MVSHRYQCTAACSGQIEKTLPIVFSADETSDVGIKYGSPITSDMPAENNAFIGTVQLVVIEADLKDYEEHLISREHLLNILMARQ